MRGQGFTSQGQGYGVMPVTVVKPGSDPGLVLPGPADCVVASLSSSGV